MKDNTTPTSKPGGESKPSEPQSASCRVLLVDDQDDLLSVMNLMLKRKGAYKIETASSGAQAIEKAPLFLPHVVISDIAMPGMDGCEMMQNLRRLENEGLAPFKAIALSGYEVDHDERMRSCGYDAHITKPVDFKSLLSMIDQMALDVTDKELKRDGQRNAG